MFTKKAEQVIEINGTMHRWCAGCFTYKPFKDFYQGNRDDFKMYVEEPVKQVMQDVATKLPEPILNLMESEKRVFARILKNDFGQGGAWDFYWGAFYPKGQKRTDSAQLSIWINYERFEYGFYIGDYGSEIRKRFDHAVLTLDKKLQPER